MLYWVNRHIKSFLEIVRLQYKFLKNGGSLGRPYRVLNSEYVMVGKRVNIKKSSRIECFPFFHGYRYNPQIIFEDGVIVGYNCTFFGTHTLRIGQDTILAGGCMVTTENHGIDPESKVPYHAQPLTSAPVSIGSGCWLGQNVCVLPGVRIGNKCIIGANAVVNKDIPDYSIAAGVPAKVLKTYNFDKHVWEQL